MHCEEHWEGKGIFEVSSPEKSCTFLNSGMISKKNSDSKHHTLSYFQRSTIKILPFFDRISEKKCILTDVREEGVILFYIDAHAFT